MCCLQPGCSINIDDYVEVSFSINPEIRKEEIDPYSGSGYILEKKSVGLKGVGQAADVWKAEKIKTASNPYL